MQTRIPGGYAGGIDKKQAENTVVFSFIRITKPKIKSMGITEKIQSLQQMLQEFHDKESELRKEINDFLKEQLNGTSEDEPKQVDITVETKGGPDGCMLLMKMKIENMFYEKNYDTVYFFETDDDMPHELDYLNLDEQMQIVNAFNEQ